MLDAAIGTGFAAVAAARVVGEAGQVIGVDISKGMLTQAERLSAGLGNVTYAQADATRLDGFGDASFDAVICSAGMLYPPVEEALAEWRRVLKPDGLVAFSAMREGFPITARLFRDCAARLGLDLPDPMAALGDERRCEDVLAHAGFTPTRTVTGDVTLPRSDVERIWRIHSTSPHYPEIRTLGMNDLAALKSRFLSEVRRLMAEDENRTLKAQVIYAFGRKPSGSPVHAPYARQPPA